MSEGGRRINAHFQSNDMQTYKNIPEYIEHVPQALLPHTQEMYFLLKKLIPTGTESIKYGMPTIELHGKNFVHFAAMKGHLGFYPTPSGVQNFENDLIKLGLSFSKGCIRLPYKTRLPVTLITKIITFRLREEKQKLGK